MVRKKPHRYKLLLDEMFPKRNRFPLLNNYHDLKHITHDFKKSGIEDTKVVAIAKKENRIVISKNFRHFRKICNENKVDLISIAENMPAELIDKQINAYLRKRMIHVMTGKEEKVTPKDWKRTIFRIQLFCETL